MTTRSLLAAVILALAASPAVAQPSTQVQAPRGLVRQLWADLEPDHLLRREGRAELPKAITTQRRDLNGDGRAEWWVEGSRVCGNANCPRWIYRELPDGRFQQVYDGAGARIDVLPLRSVGWPALVSVGHMSSSEAVYRRSEWDGRRYAWRATEYRGGTRTGADSVIYRLVMSDADTRGRRRLVLSPVYAGGGLWISASHDVCAGGRGAACGEPRLVLQSARLPAGRVCVRYRAEDSDPQYASTPGERWCGVSTAATLPGDGAGRRLVVRPTRREWAQLGSAYGLAFTGPGLPGRVEVDATGALMSFVGGLRDVYTLPCVADGDCPARR
ncbi:MAG TPA: hypothetical protein VEX86_09245 [Longimicrobium sp.]|nr:hypothetical protein [Longimicrobium sp.]